MAVKVVLYMYVYMCVSSQTIWGFMCLSSQMVWGFMCLGSQVSLFFVSGWPGDLMYVGGHVF